jgi:hypothetical protein
LSEIRVVPSFWQLGTLVVHEHEGLQQSQYRVAKPLLPVMGGLVDPGVVTPPPPLLPVPVEPPWLEPVAPPADGTVDPPAPPRLDVPPAPPLVLLPEQRPQLRLQ